MKCEVPTLSSIDIDSCVECRIGFGLVTPLRQAKLCRPSSEAIFITVGFLFLLPASPCSSHRWIHSLMLLKTGTRLMSEPVIASQNRNHAQNPKEANIELVSRRKACASWLKTADNAYIFFLYRRWLKKSWTHCERAIFSHQRCCDWFSNTHPHNVVV